MADSLYNRYRPRTLDELVGQPAVVKTIRGFGDNIPHVIMATSPKTPGVGKTSTLRILSEMVGCRTDNVLDYTEVNCGVVDTPVGFVKQLQADQYNGVMGGGKARVYVLDEIQTWVRSKGAQEAMLKLLEDPRPKNYYFLATTDPEKIIKTIRSRCIRLEFKSVAPADLRIVVERVAKAEGLDLDARVTDAIVDAAMGSPRDALQWVETVAGLAPKDRLGAIVKDSAQTAAFELVKVVAPFQGAPNWKDVSRVLSALKEDGHQPETIRRIALTACTTRLLKAQDAAAYRVLANFDEPFFDDTTAWAMLTLACYRAVCGGK